MSGDSLQEAIDFFNVKAKEARILAKAEAVVAALQTAEGRIKEADAIRDRARKDAAKIEASAKSAAEQAQAAVAAAEKEIEVAQAKIAQAGDQAARIVATANQEAASLKAAAETQAASVLASATGKRADYERHEQEAKARMMLAQAACAEAEGKLRDLESKIAKVKSEAKALLGA